MTAVNGCDQTTVQLMPLNHSSSLMIHSDWSVIRIKNDSKEKFKE